MNMNNKDIADAINNIKASIDADKYNGVMHFTLDRLIEAGIIDFKPERTLDPFRNCPGDWTAFQVATFDNGEIPVKRKRPVIQRTTMRFSGAIKVWTRQNINFSLDTQIAWKANFYLWDHTIAVRVATELLNEKKIDQATLDKMVEAVEAGGDQLMYSIPCLKDVAHGSRWMRGHIVMAKIEDGLPVGLVFDGPETHLKIDVDAWSDEQANGRELAGKVVAQARIARDVRFGAWATHIAD